MFFMFQLCVKVHTSDVVFVIAPPNNVEGVDYHMLWCTTIKKLLDNLIISGGQDFKRALVILKEKYFKQVERKSGYIFKSMNHIM